jgi:hypothetical protein
MEIELPVLIFEKRVEFFKRGKFSMNNLDYARND